MEIRCFRLTAVVIAVLGLYLPSVSRADAPPPVTDMALRDGGVLVGQIVNGDNKPTTGARVSLQDLQNHEIAAATTNAKGYFSINGLRGGVYQLVSPKGRQLYRLWLPGTAPPSAAMPIAARKARAPSRAC